MILMYTTRKRQVIMIYRRKMKEWIMWTNTKSVKMKMNTKRKMLTKNIIPNHMSLEKTKNRHINLLRGLFYYATGNIQFQLYVCTPF